MASHVPAADKLTCSRMHKFERATLVGRRAHQLSEGATPLIRTNGVTNPILIAEMEMKAGLLPSDIKRYRPDGSFELWPLNKLRY